MTQFRNLFPEEMKALQDYAAKNGRTWKSKLSYDWATCAADGVLHGLRNTHGPRWLHDFRLPKVAA